MPQRYDFLGKYAKEWDRMTKKVTNERKINCQMLKKKTKNLRISQNISNFAPQIGQERPKY